MIGCWQFKYHF